MSQSKKSLAFLDGESVLITGGTGSFGKAMVKRLLQDSNVSRVIVFSRDEFKQYHMQQEFPTSKYPQLRFFIGDVRDVDRLEMAFRNVTYVLHAAAMKHVPIAEYNPFECIHTNVIGAENVARAAMSTGIKKVIALSTDKAVSPLNLYGASKLASDKIFVAANNLGIPQGTTFSVVRYGNVVGSRGSVVQLFDELIRRGETQLPITDERMTRFFITIEEGVNFVLSCLESMYGGEVFVPKIPSARITDIARAMKPDIELKLIGIRPGEKLHEAMIAEGDSLSTYDIGDRYVIEPSLRQRDQHHYTDDGVLVPENFSYTSDGNDDWLVGDNLKAVIDSVLNPQP